MLDEISYYLMHNHHVQDIHYQIHSILVYLMVTNKLNFPYL